MAEVDQDNNQKQTMTSEQEQKIRDIARRHGIFIRGTSAMLREAYQAGREQGRWEENEACSQFIQANIGVIPMCELADAIRARLSSAPTETHQEGSEEK